MSGMFRLSGISSDVERLPKAGRPAAYYGGGYAMEVRRFHAVWVTLRRSTQVCDRSGRPSKSDSPSAALRELRTDHLGMQRFEYCERTFLVSPYQTRVTNYISGEYGGEAAVHTDILPTRESRGTLAKNP